MLHLRGCKCESLAKFRQAECSSCAIAMSDSELRRRVRDSQQAGPSNGPADEPPPDQPWIGQQLVNSAKEFAQGAWEALLASAPVQAFWRLAAVQYAYGLVQLVLAVFLQKVGMTHLHELDCTGGPARGLTAIVTGPTSGIGTETAAALVRRGAKVILACRDAKRGEALKQTLLEQAEKLGLPTSEPEVWLLDLASLKSVREFGAKWEKEQRPLHILINNAGIYNIAGARQETQDGFESHIGANHLGHFLLTLMMMPSLRRGAQDRPEFGARIVHVSSMNHVLVPRGMNVSDPHYRLPKTYDAASAYSQSKLAQILFCKEMRRRLGPESPIQVFAVHPGMVLTNVVRSLPVFVQKAYIFVFSLILLTPSEGSRASVWAATSTEAPLEGWKTLGYIDANCMPVQSSLAGQDMLQAQWLWKWSAEQVQLPANLDIVEP